jgi:asparagine synthase (glutamine-hydrolysing)
MIEQTEKQEEFESGILNDRVWLIFNGEIYNYRDLRADLEHLGHRFRSTGDTEVLLCALVTWGAGALRRLNGMYAFAYWDGRGQRLMLARDPLGIKPLLLSRTAGGLVFASELRALWKSGVVDPRVSPGAVRSFLTYGAVIEPETTLSSVVAVPPGRVITATPDGRIEVPVDVWTLDQVLHVHHGPVAAKPAQPRPEPAIHRALESAVRRHLVSDARLGVLLSGGIDSPLLAALADRAPGHTPEFITVGFEDIPSPDVEFARAIARHLHGTHMVLTLSGRDLSQRIPAAIAAMDQPTVDGVNTFVVSSAAAQIGVRVLLSGLGGDELFGGYTTFRRAPLLARFGRFAAAMAPVLAVLGTGGDDPRAWMAAGQALERVLLTACVTGLQSSFLNQPIEVAHIRMRVKTLLGCGGSPQLVLRLGYGAQPRPTPRRDLEEVLIP